MQLSRTRVWERINYFLADHLGSTNALVDASGAITSQTDYDSFGNQTGTLATRYGYTGRERDDFTGLMSYRARFYDPILGRFMSEDPIGFAGGDANLYGYVRNQPLQLRDPSGKIPPFIPIAIGIGGLILSSPSYVNAPGPHDPVYDNRNDVVANAALGTACGLAFKYVAAPIISQFLSRTGDDIIEIGIASRNGPGVYRASTDAGKYIGQSKNMGPRVESHFGGKGKLANYGREGEEFFPMPGSTQLEREVYEQYLINKAGGVDNLINVRNPMGGRMDLFNSMYADVITRYGLPW